MQIKRRACNEYKLSLFPTICYYILYSHIRFSKHYICNNTVISLLQKCLEFSRTFVQFVDVWNEYTKDDINHRINTTLYEAYSDSKYRFAVKKKWSKFSYKILLLSDSTFFKLFFHVFAAIIEALIVAGHKFLYTLLIECGRMRC